MSAPTNPNMPPAPQAPNVGQMPPDPNDPDAQRIWTNHRERTFSAAEDLQPHVESALGTLDADTDSWSDQELQRKNAKLNELREQFTTTQDPTEKARLDQLGTSLKQNIDRLQNTPHEERKVEYLQYRLATTREAYAKELATRTDTNVSILHGRKSQMSAAELEYNVANVLHTRQENIKLRPDMLTSKSDPDDVRANKVRKLTELTLLRELGEEGDTLEAGSAEKFKLAREELKWRQLNSGRYMMDESGNVVPKEAGNKFVAIRRAFQDRWNKWTEEARGNKWYSWTALKARAKKAGSIAAVGVVLGAAGGAIASSGGVIAGLATAGTVAAGSGKAIKAGVGVKLNQGAEINRAKEQAQAVIEGLHKMRGEMQAAIANGYTIDMLGLGASISEGFSNEANQAHKKNFGYAAAGGVTALLLGTGAGEAVHHLIYGDGLVFDGKGDDANAKAFNKDDNKPDFGEDNNDPTPEPEQTPEPETPKPEPEDERPKQGPGLPNDPEGDATEPTDPRADVPDNRGPEHDGPNSSDTEPENKPEEDTDTQDEKEAPGGDPDEKQPSTEQTPAEKKAEAEAEAKKAIEEAEDAQEQDAEPEQPAPVGEAKTIDAEAMKDKWVSQVYSEQLGEGGYAEMLSNADAAVKSGELEIAQNPNGTYYYKLTEAGAAKLPGAGTGSTTTYDVMRILASHSDKLKVAA